MYFFETCFDVFNEIKLNLCSLFSVVATVCVVCTVEVYSRWISLKENIRVSGRIFESRTFRYEAAVAFGPMVASH